MNITENAKLILKHLDEVKNIQREFERFEYIGKVFKQEVTPDDYEKPLFDEIFSYANSEDYKGEDIMGAFFNTYAMLQKKHSKGQVFTPFHIQHLIYETLDITESDVILDAACGTGILLTGGIPKKATLYGIEYDKDVCEMAAANMSIFKNAKAKIRNMDSSTKEASEYIKSLNVTKSINNPPYENKFNCIPICLNILNSVPKGTPVVFILPDKKFEKASKKQKTELLGNNKLCKIIKLPEDTFWGVGTTTSLYYFKAGIPQNNEKIFTAYLKESGFVKVKNQAPQDINDKWDEIEKKWINVIKTENGDETCSYINPNEHLSYQMPEKPFEISEEDFRRTAFNYMCFKKGIDVKALKEMITDAVLYNSEITSDGEHLTIKIKINNSDNIKEEGKYAK